MLSSIQTVIKQLKPAPARQVLLPCMIGLALGVSVTANADYSATLAAKGSDAVTPNQAIINIEPQDVDEAFTPDEFLANPALSDQEVMLDLQNRINADNPVANAAEQLDPLAKTAVEEQPNDGQSAPATDAESAIETTVAAR